MGLTLSFGIRRLIYFHYKFNERFLFVKLENVLILFLLWSSRWEEILLIDDIKQKLKYKINTF